MRNSTAGRTLGYVGGALGTIAAAPLLLVSTFPAVLLGVYAIPTLLVSGGCDGAMSYNANKKLEIDLSEKMREEFFIAPGCYYQTIIFVKKDEYKRDFDLSLLEGDSGENKVLHLQAIR